MSKGTLYLLPCPIGEGVPEQVLPAANFEVMRSLDYFIVENVRTARRFLSAAGIPPQDMEFAELNEHTADTDIPQLVAPLFAGRSAGVISEAGVPGVADPGALVVALCHRHGVRVVPLTGPSSILLALMASGLNGQSFAFNGYLPVKQPDRGASIRAFERRAAAESQTQIFIETPYRNGRLFDDLLSVCRPATRLCVAVDITGRDEFIRTLTVSEWRTAPRPAFDKRPAVFMIL